MQDNIIINIPDPAWGSSLARIILDLEKLRSKRLMGEVPLSIFFQLKNIFQILETLGSARIEGNNTTLAEYVEKILERLPSSQVDESQKEIQNLEMAIQWIEDNTDEKTVFTRAYVSEIHKIITKDLTFPPLGEGSKYPGDLRHHNVSIKNSSHIPPDVAILKDYFDCFLSFINKEWPEQYQLLMVAVSHHRFAYIHPFDNGNGRMVRLLSYALLIKLGFKVKKGRIINPSAVFYANRNNYYNYLSAADSLQNQDVLNWAEYFLSGLKNEIEKIDSLLSKQYVKEKLLLPVLLFSLERENITHFEHQILKYLVSQENMTMKAEDLKHLGIETSLKKSRIITKLKERNMISPLKKDGRIYTINFANNYLLRGIIKILEKEGFISEFLNKKT